MRLTVMMTAWIWFMMLNGCLAEKYVTNIEAKGKVIINIMDGKAFAYRNLRGGGGEKRVYDPSNNLIDLNNKKSAANHAESDVETKRVFHNFTVRLKTNKALSILEADMKSSNIPKKNNIISILDPLKDDDSPIVTLRKLGLTSFARLLQDSGLQSIFEKGIPYTVFAPTNAAFRRLSQSQQIAFLLDDSSTDISSYHVCPAITSIEHMKIEQMQTYNNNHISIANTRNVISVQSANIVSADIRANNSLIHIIDKVLFYEAKTLLEIIDTDPRFQLFAYISRNTSMRLLLQSKFSYTVFLPKSSVLLEHNLNLLTSNLDAREKFIRSHIYGPGILYLNNFVQGTIYRLRMTTFDERLIPARRLSENTLRIDNNILVKEGDIIAKNGVIHITDGLLL